MTSHKWILALLLCFGTAFSEVFEKYKGHGLDEVRLHYTITNAMLGALAGATLMGSNASSMTKNQNLQISIGLSGAIIGAVLGGYLGYPNKEKLSGSYEKFYFAVADGFLGALIIGYSSGYLGDYIIPQKGDLPTAGIIGFLLGAVGGGLLGGVYGYQFAVQF